MRRSVFAAVFVAGLAVSGCEAETDTDDGGSVQDSAVSAPADGAPADGAPADAAEPPADEGAGSDGAPTVAYGKTYQSPGGLTITAHAPTRFTVSEYGYAEGDFTSHTKIRLSIKNTGKKAYDANMLMLEATSGDKPTDMVFDSENGIDSEFRTILPDRTVTTTIGYGFTPGEPFTLMVSSFDGPIVTYDGVLK